MVSIQRIEPPIYLETSKGPGYAQFLIVGSLEDSLRWVVFLESGEIWNCPNETVRGCKNFSAFREKPEKPEKSEVHETPLCPKNDGGRLIPYRVEDIQGTHQVQVRSVCKTNFMPFLEFPLLNDPLPHEEWKKVMRIPKLALGGRTIEELFLIMDPEDRSHFQNLMKP